MERSGLLTDPLPGESAYHLGEIHSAWIAPQSGPDATLPAKVAGPSGMNALAHAETHAVVLPYVTAFNLEAAA